MNKNKLVLNISNKWRCMKCEYVQETAEGGEEWQFHCGDAMQMWPYKQFSVEAAPKEKVTPSV